MACYGTVQKVAIALSLITVLCASDVSVLMWNRTDDLSVFQDRRLGGHVIATTGPVYTVTQCALSCYNHPGCESYNYQADRSLCELNSHSEDSIVSSLLPHAGVIFAKKEAFTIDLESVSPCANNPCLNGGSCLAQQKDDGTPSFHCLCASNWTGEICSRPVRVLGWSDWSDWGTCSVTCGEGWQQRSRDCLDADSNVHPADLCEGLSKEERLCPDLLPCPLWDKWSDWSECTTSFTCGLGRQTRDRACLYKGIPGVDRMCRGHSMENSLCIQPSCNAPIKLSNGSSVGEGLLYVYNDIRGSWGGVCADQWSQASADIACHQIGYHRGSAVVGGSPYTEATGHEYYLSEVTCRGNETALVECAHSDWDSTIDCQSGLVHLECIVDGGWSSWSEWGECSVTCAEGVRLRHRSCNYPSPQRGGTQCPDTDTQSKSCVLPPCPVDGEWFAWSDWGECTTTCGGGRQQRSRQCNQPKHGGLTCEGEREEWQECNTHNCPIECVWEPWTGWGECNATCGGGWQLRTRESTGPFFGGDNCTGPDTEWQTCNTQHCPVDCIWSSWQDWQACSLTCGGGQQVRLREAFGPFHGGDNCSGNADDWRDCNSHHCPVDCVWNSWEEWETCSRTCGGGWQSRKRTEEGPLYGGRNCTGENEDRRTCNEDHCPVDCVWDAWTQWSACDATCGGGVRQRVRTEQGPQHEGKPCEGDAQEWSDCNQNPCPVDGYWESWSDWSACSVTCANGTQSRHRTCVEPLHGGLDCEGNDTASQDCFERHCPVDGVWGPWSGWTECSHTCGTEGSQYRLRECSPPLYGGEECPGSDGENQACNQSPCPEDGVWKAWSSWSECTVTCGGGDTTRVRECLPPLHGGDNCTGEAEQTTTCNNQPCPVAGYWEEWAPWMACSEHCGGGVTSRSRDCVEPLYGGVECEGPSNQTQACNVQPCPDDCYWLSWSDWGECDKTCGGGSQTRLRDNVGPFHGGQQCVGESQEWRACNNHSCAIDCDWLPWEAWGSCDVTCGGGQQTRHRAKDGPYFGGLECQGPPSEVKECNNNSCPVDCVWESWSEWESCSVTCGGGVQDRHRDTIGPLYGGEECTGNHSQTQPCNTQHCPVDCVWDAWQEWEECSVTCGGGVQKRHRTSQGPLYGGLQCVGNVTEKQNCNTQQCPVDGYWDSWSAWTECPVTCGGGTSHRHRECVPPMYGGEDCTGNNTDTEPCNTQPCPIPGEWLPWSSWGECSATCGGGIRIRTRDCNMTSYGDLTDPCIGETVDNETCHAFDCEPYGKTCSDYIERGLEDSNWVEIDPDGAFGNQPFMVFCDNSGEDKGLTVINHQYQNLTTVSGYEGPGEYQALLIYQDRHGSPVSVEQLISLVESSESCKQYVRWECLSAAFNPDQETLKRENKKPYILTYWENRWGEMMNYWGDAQPNTNSPWMMCGCGMTDSCLNPSQYCNCDTNNVHNWRLDEGWLTVKYDLPVTSFRAGDTGDAGIEIGKFVVGPLICDGIADYDFYSYK